RTTRRQRSNHPSVGFRCGRCRDTLTIVTTDTARVAEADRVTITPVSPRVNRVALKFGYMEIPNVPKARACSQERRLRTDAALRLRACTRAREIIEEFSLGSVASPVRPTVSRARRYHADSCRPRSWSSWGGIKQRDDIVDLGAGAGLKKRTGEARTGSEAGRKPTQSAPDT